MEIVQTPGKILQIFEDGRRIREIWTDGRKLPQDLDPRWYGWALVIGRATPGCGVDRL